MLIPAYRLADRLGRVCVKLGLKMGDEILAGARRWRSHPPTSEQVATPETTTLVHLTLTPQQIPALIFLFLTSIILIVGVTLWFERTGRETNFNAGALPTPLSGQALSTEIAQSLPALNINVSPLPAGPTPTAPPNPLSLGGTIFYAYRNSGRTNLWAQVLGRPQPVRITAGPWDDRDPAVSPDGTRLAFASRRDGTWNLYLLDLETGGVKQLTFGLDFKADPYWSPDSQWLAFELYRQDNLDIAIVNAAGGDLIPLTADPAADYEPAWSPNGRSIVWVSMRGGNPDLWGLSLDDPNERSYQPLTDTPVIQETDPTFSPNGDLVVYTDAASPLGLVYTHSATDPKDVAVEVGQGQFPAWSPEGSSLLTVAPQESGADYLLAAPFGQPGLAQIAYKATSGHIGAVTWSSIILPETLAGSMAQASEIADAPVWSEQISVPRAADPPYTFVSLPGVNAPDPHLSDRVDEAFTGLRRTIAQSVAWDFLATLDNASSP